MQFTFKARNKEGGIIEGVRDSFDKLSLARDLRGEGLMLFSAESLQKGKILEILAKINLITSFISLREKIVFARNLSAMISAGLALSRAIEILEKQTANEKFKLVIASLSFNVKKGKTLSESLAEHPKIFSPLFIAMVRSGEESGGLAKALNETATHLEQSYNLIRKVRGALIYPAIVVTAIVGIGILMLIYVVPTLTSTFKELKVELPVSTKTIILISDLLANYTVSFLALLGAALFLFFLFLKTKIGGRTLDFVLLRLPVLGSLVKEVNTARTTRTLSSLIVAGVPITGAISIVKDVLQNSFYKETLDEALILVEKGSPLSQMFREKTSLYPVMVGEMMEVGEETGKLSDMLADVAKFYEEEVDSATRDLSTIVEPVLMIIVGGAVGFFAVSMITPMYSLMNNV
ncbi:MAG: type II secretion system F family protein [Patescibacteria group bacterium]